MPGISISRGSEVGIRDGVAVRSKGRVLEPDGEDLGASSDLDSLERASADFTGPIRRLLSTGGCPDLVFQPIVDLARGLTAGFEALSRFPGPLKAGPDVWFAVAARLGYGAELESRVIERALDAAATLPINTFLTINVSPHLLGAAQIQRVLHQDLTGIVLELTEHTDVPDRAGFLHQLEELRSRGAKIAVDDAGVGYSNLRQLMLVRPEIVKLDRSLVAGMDRDEAKIALAELIGEFTSRLDGWLLAEGVETVGELATLARMGVPLGQGWLLGRPASQWSVLPSATGELIRGLARRSQEVDRIASILEGRRGAHSADEALAMFAADSSLQVAVEVDQAGRPVGVWQRSTVGAAPCRAQSAVVAATSATIAELAHRAVNRDPGQRFDPIPVTDGAGHSVGFVRMERLLLALAAERH